MEIGHRQEIPIRNEVQASYQHLNSKIEARKFEIEDSSPKNLGPKIPAQKTKFKDSRFKIQAKRHVFEDLIRRIQVRKSIFNGCPWTLYIEVHRNFNRGMDNEKAIHM